jgi:hypothetical protein
LGPDPRRALWPAASPPHKTGRTHDRTRPMLQQLRKFLPRRRRRFCCDAHPDLLYFHNLWGAMEQREFITLLGHAALYD